MKFKAKIFVTLRPSVLDPAGTAVKSALEHLIQNSEQKPDRNLEQIQNEIEIGIDSVRIGKFIEMIFNAKDREMATERVNLACDRLLANPVIETYTFELAIES